MSIAGSRVRCCGPRRNYLDSKACLAEALAACILVRETLSVGAGCSLSDNSIRHCNMFANLDF